MENISNDKIKEMSELFKNLSQVLKSADKNFSDFLLTLSGGISVVNNFNKILNVGDKISSVEKTLKGISNVAKKYSKEFQQNLTGAYSVVRKSYQRMVDDFQKKGLGGMVDTLGLKFKLFGQDVSGRLSNVKKSFISFYDKIKDNGGVLKSLDKLGLKCKLSFQDAFNSIQEKASGAWDSFKSDPFTPLLKGLSKFGGAVGSVFKIGIIGGIALAVIAIGGFIAYFKQLMDTNEEFRTKITEAWAGVKEAFQPAIDAFGELFACLFTGKEEVDAGGTDVVNSFLSVATGIIEVISGAVGFISDIFIAITGFIKDILFSSADETEGKTKTTWDTIVEGFKGVWDVLQGIVEVGVAAFNLIWSIFGDDIIAIFSTVWATVGSLLSAAMKIVGGLLEIFVGIFTGNFGKIKKGISKVFGGIVNFIGSALKGLVNVGIEGINFFIRKINSLLSVASKVPGLGKLIGSAQIKLIPKLAEGGLVSPGELFIAREAGPELVGSFGAKAAVMNNNQIVDAVSNGVYRAVTAAMGGGNGGNYTFNITNTLDGNAIGKQVIKYHNGVVKQTGVSPLLT